MRSQGFSIVSAGFTLSKRFFFSSIWILSFPAASPPVAAAVLRFITNQIVIQLVLGSSDSLLCAFFMMFIFDAFSRTHDL